MSFHFTGTILLLTGFSWAAKNCNVCQVDNEIYCVNQTNYYLCMDKIPMKNKLFACTENTVCSNTNEICTPVANINGVAIIDVCGMNDDSSSTNCGICSTNSTVKYTCISETEYARCENGVPSSILINACEENETCVQDALVDHGNICVPQCVIDYNQYTVSCLNEQIITTTSHGTTTTPSMSDLVAACKKHQADTNSKTYFYIKNDKDEECKSYIYCEQMGSNMIAIYLDCKSGYFNSKTNECQASKPDDCAEITTAQTDTESNASLTTKGTTITTPVTAESTSVDSNITL